MSHGPIVRATLPLPYKIFKHAPIIKASRFVSAGQWPQPSTCFNCKVQAAITAHLARTFSTSRCRPAKNRIQPIGTSGSRHQQSQSQPAVGRPPESPAKPARQHRVKFQVTISRSEASRVFGDKYSLEDIVHVLQQVHTRRLDGSLASEGFANLDLPANINDAQLLTGLEYLRAQYPLDEEAYRERYVEQQLALAEKSLLARAQNIGLYKKDPTDVEAAKAYEAGLSAVDRGSVLVQRRLAREAEKKAEKEADEKALAKGGEAAAKVAAKEKNRQLVLPWNNAELTPEQRDREIYIQKLRHEAELDPEKILADRSATSRLLAPTAFALIVMALSYAFAEFYVPPAQEARLWSNTSPSLSTCFTIVIANTLVFIAWRRPELWKFMNRNFLLAVGYPRLSGMLGNLFSHQQIGHLFVNMTALMLFGPTIHDEIGRGNFLALFMISGMGGALANLWWNVLTKNLTVASLGASGCLYGLIGAYFMLKKDLFLQVPFSKSRIEYSGETGLIVLLALEMLAFWRYKGQGGIDHTSHIGGLLAGLLYARILKARAKAAEGARKKPVSTIVTE